MRQRPTPAEKRFRVILAECCKVLDCQFEFQKTFWNDSQAKAYIVDFYIPDYQVVIEVDGPYHNDIEQIAADAARDSWFISNKKRVLRVLNSQTFDQGYCKDLLYETLKVKRHKPKRKRVKRVRVFQDFQGITQCPAYTEGDFKRDNYLEWRKRPKGPRPRKLTMQRN